MRETFTGWYPKRPEAIAKLWDVAIFVPDANVLLHCLRHPATVRDELLRLFEALGEALWIPYQVGLEFHRNRLDVEFDWVMRFNAEGPDGLRDRRAPGPTPRLTAAHRQALAAQIDGGPIPAVHGVVRWRLSDLGQWLWEEFRVSLSPQTLSREVRAMGYRKLSARPKHHAQAVGAIAAFKKRMA